MIDMHAHWRPAELAEAMRSRTKEPRIVKNPDGTEIVKSRMGDQPLSEAFDNADDYLAQMDRQGVKLSVLSLLGQYCWIESQPLETSVHLCRTVNDSFSRICAKYSGRFAAHAALPLVDLGAAIDELDRALALPGMIGAQLPGNAFLNAKEAEKMRPLMEAANRHKAVLFIHHGPRPGDPFPKIPGDIDNARRRNGTLDMQASLSSVMVTFCLTDYLAPYPDLTVYLHNLGGNIPYEVGPRAIEAGVRLYGAERIVCGTDGTEFGISWTQKALEEADIGDEAREQILRGNAAAMLARRAASAKKQRAAA
jgi:predicted TIM-barrel fold metal-dependent hydrolase